MPLRPPTHQRLQFSITSFVAAIVGGGDLMITFMRAKAALRKDSHYAVMHGQEAARAYAMALGMAFCLEAVLVLVLVSRGSCAPRAVLMPDASLLERVSVSLHAAGVCASAGAHAQRTVPHVRCGPRKS